jgi:hypothetical protein
MTQPSDIDAKPRRKAVIMTKTTKTIIAVVLAGVLLLGATAYVVLRPDRDRCYAALDHQITTWLASSETLEALPEPSADAWRKELRWPCRFMTDAQLQSVMNQVMSAHMGELLIRGFTEAFAER